jgi:hypothetical protein
MIADPGDVCVSCFGLSLLAALVPLGICLIRLINQTVRDPDWRRARRESSWDESIEVEWQTPEKRRPEPDQGIRPSR